MNAPWDNIQLVFQSGWSLPLVAALLLLAACVAIWMNRATRPVVSRRVYLALTALELLATLLLLLWFVNPRVRYQTRSDRDNELAVLVDRSMSMDTRDAVGGRSRYEVARDLLFAGETPLRDLLARKAKLDFFTFDAALKEQPLAEFPSAPNPAGLRTDLAEALETLRAKSRTRPVQGVILLTDGASNGQGDLRRAARDLKLPIYAVGLGRKDADLDAWKDIGLASVDVPTRVNVDQAVEVKVNLRQTGFSGTVLPVQLREGNAQLASQTLSLGDAPAQIVSLKFTPTVKGTHTYRLTIPHQENDRLAENDALEFSVLAARGDLRVLYAEGSLRWVYKFLRRILEREETVKADCVIRTGGGKLYQQGESEIRLAGALPERLEDLARYDVIILGDFPRNLLPDAQLKLLDQYVKQKKGGLLVIGGANLLATKDYVGSPLESLLPSGLIPSAAAPASADKSSKLTLTAAGRSATALAELDKFMTRLPIRRVYDVGPVKPGAEVWLEADAGGRARPVILAQRYGEGRAMLLATEDLWEANLREGGKPESSPMARFWLQSIQWLAQREKESDAGDPLLMAWTDKSYYEPGDTVLIKAQLRKPPATDKKPAQPKIRGEARVGDQVVDTLNFSKPSAGGTSQVAWRAPQDGHFEIRLAAERGAEKDEVRCRFTVGRPYQEMERNSLDESLLRELAASSGGAYFTALNAPDVAASIERGATTAGRTVERDLVDSFPVFMLFCLVVSAEWILRRRRNLI